MQERIFQYLAESDKALSADRILREVLKVHSPNCLAAHRVLEGILAQDRRFNHTRTGLWWVSRRGSVEQITRLDSPGVLFLEATRGSERFVRGALYVPQTGEVKEFTTAGLASSADRHALRLARDEAELRTLFTWGPADLRLWNWLLRHEQLTEWAGQTLYLGALAARVLPSPPARLRPADLASLLELSPPDQEQPAAMARYLADCLLQLMQRVPQTYRTGAEQLQQWIAAGEPKVDFGRFSFGPDFLLSLPESPGVYIMRRAGGEAIYVGKASNLRRRVRSYFTVLATRNQKVARLHEQLHALEYISTSSEVEALLLEVRLIRDLRPAINLQVGVHERSRHRSRTRNLILLVRNQKNGEAQLYFLRKGAFVAQVAARPGRKLTQRVRERVRSVYFTASSRTRRRESWETGIVTTWLASHGRRLNLLDVDEAGSYDAVLKRLEEFLRDPDLFRDKVYHR